MSDQATVVYHDDLVGESPEFGEVMTGHEHRTAGGCEGAPKRS